MTLSSVRRTLPAFVLSLAAFAPGCWSQAAATALRAGAISVFAAAQRTDTDYASTNYGYMVGGDFTYHLRLFDASLDVRFNQDKGDVVDEKSFDGGVKLERTYRNRLHPYLHFLVGYGVVNFATPIIPTGGGKPYSYDDSIVYDFGGGVDIDLTRNFAFKVDGQYQFWHLGYGSNLNPTLISAGLVYRIPYRRLRPH